MSEPDKVCILNGPDGRHLVTSLEFPVCHWRPEDKPLHLDIHETELGRPVGQPIARSSCFHSDIVNGKAVFKFSDPFIMEDDLYGFAFFTNADELALFNVEGEPVPIASKNAAMFQSSDFLITEPQEDLVFTLPASIFTVSTTKE